MDAVCITVEPGFDESVINELIPNVSYELDDDNYCYCVINGDGIVAVFSKYKYAAAFIENKRICIVPYALDKDSQKEYVYVLLETHTNSVLYVTNNVNLARDVQRQFALVGLTYIDDIELSYKHKIDEITDAHVDKLESLNVNRIIDMYCELEGFENPDVPQEKDHVKDYVSDMVDTSIKTALESLHHV